MSFVFSDEQEELRRTVRSFLDSTSPETVVRRLMDTADGYDPAVWKQMGEQLGLQGLHVPEEFGGSGFGYVELGIVLEEMGAHLLCAPFFASAVLATGALLAAEDAAAKKELLPGLATGSTIGTLAFAGADGRPETTSTRGVLATRSGAGYLLRGTRGFVLDGALADLILVTAWTDSGLSLFAVAEGAEGLTRSRLPVMDLTRKQADLTFDGTPARLIGVEGDAGPVLARVLHLACVALANESVGGARTVLDQAVRYAKERFQFGRPIGSFQAVKHKCADILAGVEGSKSVAYHAADVVAAGDGERLPRRVPGQGVRRRGLLLGGGGEDPDPRRDRIHLGTPGPPVLKTREVGGTAVRRPRPPPRPAGRPPRHLSGRDGAAGLRVSLG